MKIVDFRCTLIGPYPVLRLVTDVGIDGFSQAESSKGDNPGAVNIVPQVMVYKPMVLGCDPTDVQRVVEQIRRMGGFKPWGAAVSMIEVACLDIAGKALGCPVYKLLGGKVRDRVRVYNGNLRPPIAACAPGDVGALAEAYAANTREMRESEEGSFARSSLCSVWISLESAFTSASAWLRWLLLFLVPDPAVPASLLSSIDALVDLAAAS